MHIGSIGRPSLPAGDIAATFGHLCHTGLQILCLAALVIAVLGVRHLAFEYNHGDREMVLRLLDSLSP
jgi:hypothetical protein